MQVCGLPTTLAQFCHWYDVGEFVHEAVRVSVVFTLGDVELGEIVQYGVGLDGGGGGVDVPPVRHSTLTPDFWLAPALLLATTA